MDFALTKIQPPRPRASFIERGQVQARLAVALRNQRLVLLCAPGGFGKTVSLAHELAKLPPDHAIVWVAADEGDDLHRLLDCMLVALEPLDPPWRIAPEAVLNAASSDDVEQLRRAVAELINALNVCSVPHGVIVFDDVHRVTDAVFFRFLDLMLERLTPRWTVALASRTDPPLSVLPRLRAAGDVEEIRQLHLQFARDEARQLASDAGLEATLADRLFDRTHGWPAGLRIAIGALRGAGAEADVDRALRAGERPLFEFLVNEVLVQLPQPLAHFLLTTSVLPELTPSRCVAVTGEPAAKHLDAIEQLGLFVDVLTVGGADAERTLRLHDLFRDALQERLRVDRPDEWRACLQRAAETETDPVRRQALWLAAGSEARAAQDLKAAAPSMNLSGAVSTVLRLCAAYTSSFAASSPELQMVMALAKQTVWQLQEAERHYAAAQRLYQERGDAAAEQIAIARRAAILAPLGRLTEASQLLSALTPSLLDAEGEMMAATAQLWLTLERCEFDQVAARFGDLLRLQLSTDRLVDWQTIPPPRVTASRGAAPLVAQWAEAALRVAGDRPVPLRALALIALGWCALWQARLTEASELLARAETDAHWAGLEVIARSHGLALRAVLALARGDRTAAVQAMQTRIAEQPAGYGGWGLWHALFVATRVAAGCDDVAHARAWLTQMLALHPTLPEVSPARLSPALGVQGTVAWLEGRREEAITHWKEALAQEGACDLMSHAAELRVRLAAACLREGEVSQAASWLAPALDAPGEGPRGALFAAAALCELARVDWRGQLSPAAQATLASWAASLTAAAPASPGTAAVTPVADAAVGTERLTARELEVLSRIAGGDSNKLIARAFDLSLHTVKRHVANILDKLAVETRGQAAAWYRANVR